MSKNEYATLTLKLPNGKVAFRSEFQLDYLLSVLVGSTDPAVEKLASEVKAIKQGRKTANYERLRDLDTYVLDNAPRGANKLTINGMEAVWGLHCEGYSAVEISKFFEGRISHDTVSRFVKQVKSYQ